MAATQVTVAGLGPGETAWRVAGGETVVVRIAAATKDADPEWLFLVLESRVIDSTGATVTAFPRFVHSVRAGDLETVEPLSAHITRQRQAALERIQNVLAARRALDTLPRVEL